MLQRSFRRAFHATGATQKSGILDSLLHGTGSTEGDDIKTTHSKKVARGKYVHELVYHKIKPEYMEQYTQLINEEYPKIAANPENDVHHVGSWKTIIGQLDTAIHLWEHKGYSGYHKTNDALAKNAAYQKFLKELAPTIESRRNEICLEFAFWETISPAKKLNGGLYELRSYALKPGNLLEWEQHWKPGLHARRKFCTPVGAWFTQLGPLHTVHHMWVYPDLHTRKISREQAWQIPGWAETVETTVHLVTKMQTEILEPFKCSPLK